MSGFRVGLGTAVIFLIFGELGHPFCLRQDTSHFAFGNRQPDGVERSGSRRNRQECKERITTEAQMQAATRILSAIEAIAIIATVCSCAVGPDFHPVAAPKVSGYTPSPLPAHTASADVIAGSAQTLQAGEDIPGQWWSLRLAHRPRIADHQAVGIRIVAVSVARMNEHLEVLLVDDAAWIRPAGESKAMIRGPRLIAPG
jgi:hypothetical protein